MAVERVRGKRARAEVIEYLRGREPETSVALAHLTRSGPRRHSKIWVVWRGKQIAGVLLIARWCPGRWVGRIYLDDLALAPEVARIVERSNAWTVTGPADGVEAVLERTKRSRGSVRMWFYSIAPQPSEPDTDFTRNSDVTIRAARARDLPGLVDLYSMDEHSGGTTRRRLRSMLAARIPELLVAELDDHIVGALACPGTGVYRVWDMLMVDPAARGMHIGMALLLDAGIDAVAAGHGICGLRVMTNGLRIRHEDVLSLGEAEVWATGELHPRVIFRGHGRLRRFLIALEGGPILPQVAEPSPFSVLPKQPDRAGTREV